MDAGLLQTTPGSFSTGKFLPPVSSNPLAHQDGALLLIDPTDPDDPWAGLPANGGLIKNLACWKLAELLNSRALSRYTDYQCSWNDQHVNANEIKFEMTGKGGFHGLPSQANNGTANRGGYMRIPTALQAYLYANPGHAYFSGLIGSKTRDRAGTSQFPRSGSFRTFTTTNNTRTTFEFNGSTASITGNINGGSHAYQNPDGSAKAGASLGSFVASAASSAWATTLPSSAIDVAVQLFWGTSQDNSGALNACHGWIEYLWYMEDLTVSGRGFADVQADMLAQAAANFADGGRWAGDTHTDPTAFA